LISATESINETYKKDFETKLQIAKQKFEVEQFDMFEQKLKEINRRSQQMQTELTDKLSNKKQKYKQRIVEFEKTIKEMKHQNKEVNLQ
jgi:phage host-nuclease inhibitor protein Gam